MIVTSKYAIKNIETYLIFFQLFTHFSSPIFLSTHTLSLYFLFDMSYNSSHLRTNSVNFSSIYEDKNRQHSLQANTRSVVEETQDCSHYRNRAGTDRSGPVPSRQTFSLNNGDGTELRRDGYVPVSVNISV